jgi:C1A family cysteine protease
MKDGRRIEADDCIADITLTEWRTQNLSIKRKKQMEREHYKGPVYCATVPNSTLITRRNGTVLISGNSCTANALAGAVEYLEMKQDKSFEDASRLFIYYNERMLEGTICADAGAELRDGIKTLVKFGVCREKLLPYEPKKFTRKPSKKCYTAALDHRITKYYKIASLEGMRECLAMGFPFSFGFAVFESFETKEVAKTGMMPMPNPEVEELLGGHAVLAVGYDDEKRLFKIRNSWGERWGEFGYFYMDYSYIADKRFCSDFWVVTKQM